MWLLAAERLKTNVCLSTFIIRLKWHQIKRLHAVNHESTYSYCTSKQNLLLVQLLLLLSCFSLLHKSLS
ncbi:hypothetical protein SRHO_G00286220 [Serrasalmus rhombeus]